MWLPQVLHQPRTPGRGPGLRARGAAGWDDHHHHQGRRETGPGNTANLRLARTCPVTRTPAPSPTTSCGRSGQSAPPAAAAASRGGPALALSRYCVIILLFQVQDVRQREDAAAGDDQLSPEGVHLITMIMIIIILLTMSRSPTPPPRPRRPSRPTSGPRAPWPSRLQLQEVNTKLVIINFSQLMDLTLALHINKMQKRMMTL